MAEGKVIAFEYDNSTTGSDAPVMLAVVPGYWTPGEPVKPEAFGMTVEQMREAVAAFNLPLREVRVAAKDAVTVPDRGALHLPSEDSAMRLPDKPSDDVIETAGGPIPAPIPAGRHRPLNEHAAAQIARNTVLSEGGTLQAAADAAREVGGRYGDQLADLTLRGADAYDAAVTKQQADEGVPVEDVEQVAETAAGEGA